MVIDITNIIRFSADILLVTVCCTVSAIELVGSCCCSNWLSVNPTTTGLQVYWSIGLQVYWSVATALVVSASTQCCFW